ncbi:MAG: 16S rRNA (adenine(1518)-N(6)/adenine(1519)-N(6))-dimethyltransferase RsmA [Bacteroidia bacterium]|nr:16S rRNA (adenine(1518)-N(6)/adenine(1519)-N(6))-dimethyltransferase RsmA [Bacteroidia bacterium]
MYTIKPKKKLGQHFLIDKNIAFKIVNSLHSGIQGKVLELGPGTGMLTQFLVQIPAIELTVVELDDESVMFLYEAYPNLGKRIIHADFLRLDLTQLMNGTFSLIGNFPYNISSQILFKVLEYKDLIPEVVCMLQKEMAERIVSGEGSKIYGIVSVLLQSFYHVDYLFTVSENVFYPPPKVKSAVIRLSRNDTKKLDCNETLFVRVVKTCFNQRRKMIRNSIKSLTSAAFVTDHPFLSLRPEQLSVAQFVELTNFVESAGYQLL